MSNPRRNQTAHNTQARTSVSIVVNNPTRRSRAERTLALMTMTSYPHYLIGNVSNIISGSDERAAKAALAIENKFCLLDFIRSFSMERKSGSFEFNTYGITLDAQVNKINLAQMNATGKLLTSSGSIGDASVEVLGESSGLVRQMVECFHRNQAGGMTRKFDINSPYWRLVSRKLTLSKDKPQLKALGKEETSESINVEQATQLVLDTLALPEYRVVFGVGSIALTVGDTTREILFEIPPRS